MSRAKRQPGEPVTRTCRLTGRPGSALPCSRFGQVSPGRPRALSYHSPARRGRPAAAERRGEPVGLRQGGHGQHEIEQVLGGQARHGRRPDVGDGGVAAELRPQGVPDPVDHPGRLPRPGRIRGHDAQRTVGRGVPAESQVLLVRPQPVLPQPLDPRVAAPRGPRCWRARTSAAAAPDGVVGLRGDPGCRLLLRSSHGSATSRRIRTAGSASTTTTRWYDARQPGLDQQRYVVDHDRVGGGGRGQFRAYARVPGGG